MNLPSFKQVGNQGVNTLARIGGATAGKLALSTLKKQGLLWSMLLLVGGLLITIYGPDKFKVKEMGEGLALFGGLKVINDLAQPTIDLGLGNALPQPLRGLALPETVRSAMATYFPQIDGVTVTVYDPKYPTIPGKEVNAQLMNGLPVFDSNAGRPKSPAVVNIDGMGGIPVIAA